MPFLPPNQQRQSTESKPVHISRPNQEIKEALAVKMQLAVDAA